jgi:hypothetical protein
MTAAYQGGCLCGAIRFEVHGPLRAVVNCHCGQCLRFHGHYAAYTAASKSRVQIRDPKALLKWYRSSEHIRRGFCGHCGSSLFWDPYKGDTMSIAAGSLDQPTGLHTRAHIFTVHLADYYTLTDALEKRPQGLAD